MLIVDSQLFERPDFLRRWQDMQELQPFRQPDGKRYALCLKHAFDLISVLLYLKEKGGSVLLMHDSTPYETAVATASRADCTYLLYEKWDSAVPINATSVQYAPSLLQYSSGTTRAPALISRTWEEVEVETASYNELFRDDSPPLQPIILVPVSHSFGLVTGVLAALGRGGVPTVIQQKNPKFAIHAIAQKPDHVVYTVPYLFNILDSMSKDGGRYKRIVISGSPPTEQVLNRMKGQSEEVWQQYGCTEAGCISVAKQPVSPTDVGLPLGHHQLTIDSPLNESGFLQGEVSTQIDSRRIQTGDLGYINPQNGRLHIQGRLDDLINVSGLKVIPIEVEAVIREMPGVEEALVLKTDHPVWGEAVRALAVVSPGVTDKDIRGWCIKHLPPYKVPGTVELVSEIPRTPAGKISRKYIQSQERSK